MKTDTIEATAASAIQLAIKRLNEQIRPLPPFSEQRHFLVEQRSKLADVQRALEQQ